MLVLSNKSDYKELKKSQRNYTKTREKHTQNQKLSKIYSEELLSSISILQGIKKQQIKGLEKVEKLSEQSLEDNSETYTQLLEQKVSELLFENQFTGPVKYSYYNIYKLYKYINIYSYS